MAAACFCSSACSSAWACEGTAADWSRSYLALRSVRGHFDGGPWTASVDRWNGERHQAMQCLANHASAQAATAAQLLLWMGEPDERLRCPSPECKAYTAANGGAAEVWVYRWRGKHDQLGFAISAQRVGASAWLYVGE